MTWSVVRLSAKARVFGGVLRPRFLIASFLVAGGGLLWPRGARADIVTVLPVDTKFYGDDTHTSVLHPLTEVMGENENGVDKPGGLINAGTSAFMKANPADGTGPFIAIYELDCDDLDAAVRRLRELGASGKMTGLENLAMDPKPIPRVYREIGSYEP